MVPFFRTFSVAMSTTRRFDLRSLLGCSMSCVFAVLGPDCSYCLVFDFLACAAACAAQLLPTITLLLASSPRRGLRSRSGYLSEYGSATLPRARAAALAPVWRPQLDERLPFSARASTTHTVVSAKDDSPPPLLWMGGLRPRVRFSCGPPGTAQHGSATADAGVSTSPLRQRFSFAARTSPFPVPRSYAVQIGLAHTAPSLPGARPPPASGRLPHFSRRSNGRSRPFVSAWELDPRDFRRLSAWEVHFWSALCRRPSTPGLGLRLILRSTGNRC